MAKSARKKKPRAGERDDSPGLAVRRVAADIIEGVLLRHRALHEMLEGSDARAATAALAALDDRDRGLTRAIVAVVLRRLGTLRHLLGLLLDRGLPAKAPRLETALRTIGSVLSFRFRLIWSESITKGQRNSPLFFRMPASGR